MNDPNLAAFFRSDPTARHAERRIDDYSEELATRCDDGCIVVATVQNTDSGQVVTPGQILTLEGIPVNVPVPSTAEIAATAVRLIHEGLGKVDGLRKADGSVDTEVLGKVIGDAMLKAYAPFYASLEARIDAIQRSRDEDRAAYYAQYGRQ